MQTISYNLTKEKLVLLYSDCFLIPSFTSSIIWIFPGRETSYWKIRDLLKKTKLMKLLQIHPDYENLLSKFPGPLRQLLVKRLYEFELQPSDQEVQLSKGGQGFIEWEMGAQEWGKEIIFPRSHLLQYSASPKHLTLTPLSLSHPTSVVTTITMLLSLTTIVTPSPFWWARLHLLQACCNQ